MKNKKEEEEEGEEGQRKGRGSRRRRIRRKASGKESYGGAGGKEPPAVAGDIREDSGLIPWRREQQLTPLFLPGKSQGQRSLAAYSPWGHKELDMTE